MHTHTHTPVDSVNVVCICVNIYTRTCKLGPHTWYRQRSRVWKPTPEELEKTHLDFVNYIMYVIHKRGPNLGAYSDRGF